MGGGRELGHVHADLRDDHLGGAPPDPGDRHQPLRPLIERAHHVCDPTVQPVDGSGQLVDVGQVRAQHDPVMLAEPAAHRLP